jgi:hypothetical protein
LRIEIKKASEHKHIRIYIQYWCIDGKYRIYVARLRNGERRAFSEYCIYPAIKFAIDTSIVVPIRGVA